MLKLLLSFIGPTMLFVFLALGLVLLLTSRERLEERFSEILFALTRKTYAEDEIISQRMLVLVSRVGGVIALVLALVGGVMVVDSLGL